MQSVIRRVRAVDWGGLRRDGHNLFTKLIRTKDPRDSDATDATGSGRQRLPRCLTTMDLTSLGVGSCVGTGMYLVAGMVARKFAGPAVVISFIIAALASIFSGACYAEFGVRVPNTTGSAYMYSYVTVGEFIAFIIGWNMILEYLIGSSACARALSACFDSLFNGAINRELANKFGTIYGKPPDVLAFSISLLMMLVLVAGVRKSLFFNNLLNAINLSVWVFIMTAGLFYVDIQNWTEHKGFLPYGWSGVFSGAATCFYAFIGFDIIATTGEEANNPKRSIPLAIIYSLGIILLAYVSTSMMLTLIGLAIIRLLPRPVISSLSPSTDMVVLLARLLASFFAILIDYFMARINNTNQNERHGFSDIMYYRDESNYERNRDSTIDMYSTSSSESDLSPFGLETIHEVNEEYDFDLDNDSSFSSVVDLRQSPWVFRLVRSAPIVWLQRLLANIVQSFRNVQIRTFIACTIIAIGLSVPYDEVNTDSALVQMFTHVNAPTCTYIVAVGALAGLTVSMFGSMFPMPRIVYAMAQDGLIFRSLAAISANTGTPAFATICGGIAASFVALLIQLEVLVEMMSIGTLLAYTLVSTCVLVLRYQPHSTNLIELLPQSLRTPVDPEGTASANRETTFAVGGPTHIMPTTQRVMVRRVTRSSPDSDDTLPGDESEEYGRDDTFLVNSNNENKFYGAVGGGSSGSSNMCERFFTAISRQLNSMTYLCPGLFPWIDLGPATEQSGMFVIKSVGVMYGLIILFDILAAYGNPYESTTTCVAMVILLLGILFILLKISRKPQNRVALVYTTPGLPFVPTIAITVNIYLILNLSILTLLRFTIWMILGLIMYFKYGIKNSTLETNPPVPQAPTPPVPNPLDRTTIPPPSPHPPRPTGDRNIFEGDGNNGLYGNMEYPDPLLTWHESDFQQPAQGNERGQLSSTQTGYRQVESRYNTRTQSTTSHTMSRPPWAYPDSAYGNWDD